MSISFQELASQYLSSHLAKKSSIAYYNRLFSQFFATWTDHKTCFEIRAWHLSLQKTPAHANKALGFLRAMYSWAHRTGDHTGKAALWAGENPTIGVRRHRTYSRERVFSDTELVQLFTYLEFAYPKLQAFLTVLLCTGCRMSEARQMKWIHIDLEQGYWFKPTTKNGMSHRIPLASQAVAALAAMPREGDYVFMGLYGQCWSRCGAEKAWGIFRKGPGLDTLTLHDFRRTVGSRVYEQTNDVILVKAILNHRPNSVTEIYMRTQHARIAAALQAHADKLWIFRKEVPHDTILHHSPLSADPVGVPIRRKPEARACPTGLGELPNA